MILAGIEKKRSNLGNKSPAPQGGNRKENENSTELDYCLKLRPVALKK